jgi:hypothetical protein
MYATPAPRELIVVVRPEIGLRLTIKGLDSLSGSPIDSLAALLDSANASLEPLFGISEDLLEFRFSNTLAETVKPGHWSRFYRLSVADSDWEVLARQMRAHPAVESVFIKPGVEPPVRRSGRILAPADAATVTEDLSNRQIYLGPPPRGINAIAAWQRPGGGGGFPGNVTQIIDVEGAWRFTHEDLAENQGGVVGGTETPELDWRNHGTAVLGILSADRNNGHNIGILGVSPEANVCSVSVFGQPSGQFPLNSGTAAAIRQAADKLNAGDVMLLELHAPGPQFDFQEREDQLGYIPVEWWPDNLLAIQYAVARKIIVVEAAGNGSADLNDPILNNNPNSPHGPFPADWRNPLPRADVDSGAILVGAGAPPRGTNGTNLGPGRSRLDFSNFGSMIDAQGWGHEVTTCGFGDLQGIDEDRWYTPDFGGTSAAAPMIAGALASVQGVLRAAGRPLLTPARARELLRTTGSPQRDADPAEHRPATQRIGSQPDILQMLAQLGM